MAWLRFLTTAVGGEFFRTSLYFRPSWHSVDLILSADRKPALISKLVVRVFISHRRFDFLLQLHNANVESNLYKRYFNRMIKTILCYIPQLNKHELTTALVKRHVRHCSRHTHVQMNADHFTSVFFVSIEKHSFSLTTNLPQRLPYSLPQCLHSQELSLLENIPFSLPSHCLPFP